MKTYTVKQFTCGEHVDVLVNVPTPKELQCITVRNYIKVIITNLSTERQDQYGVAVYIRRNGEFPLRPEFQANMFTGRNARKDAIARASECLVGRYI